MRIEVGGVDLSSHFGWARGPMVTRSEAGGTLPPVLGALSAQVIAKRPDLESLRGHLVRVPRTLDVDIAVFGRELAGDCTEFPISRCHLDSHYTLTLHTHTYTPDERARRESARA